MRSDYECIKYLVVILEYCASGGEVAETTLNELDNCQWTESRLLMDACHTLWHYRLDKDIRAKDPSYAKDQRERLRSYAFSIRSSFSIKNPD